ncbi:MAG: pilus assembly protein [Clostridia bacterium]|jgi:Flp pilus assembly protein TadG|nr:pilus assembly protein [Clostridia bacterium]
MKLLLQKLRESNRGQALVELALILPLLLLLIFGIIEFGRVFSTQLMVAHGAREGVRQATVGASDQVIFEKVKASAPFLEEGSLIVTITPEEALRTRGEGVKVKVIYPVTIYAPIISQVLGNPYIAASEVTMRVE